MFTIDTRSIPADESLLIKAVVDEDIFQLPKDDLQQPKGPLSIEAEASVVTGNLLVRGDFRQTFGLVCSRCSEPFDFEVKLEDHSLLSPLGNEALIDLTDDLREDILLALPGFPHCDAVPPTGSGPQRKCPAAGSFQPEGEFEALDPESDEVETPNDWGELDQIKFDES